MGGLRKIRPKIKRGSACLNHQEPIQRRWSSVARCRGNESSTRGRSCDGLWPWAHIHQLRAVMGCGVVCGRRQEPIRALLFLESRKKQASKPKWLVKKQKSRQACDAGRTWTSLVVFWSGPKSIPAMLGVFTGIGDQHRRVRRPCSGRGTLCETMVCLRTIVWWRTNGLNVHEWRISWDQRWDFNEISTTNSIDNDCRSLKLACTTPNWWPWLWFKGPSPRTRTTRCDIVLGFQAGLQACLAHWMRFHGSRLARLADAGYWPGVGSLLSGATSSCPTFGSKNPNF